MKRQTERESESNQIVDLFKAVKMSVVVSGEILEDLSLFFLDKKREKYVVQNRQKTTVP